MISTKSNCFFLVIFIASQIYLVSTAPSIQLPPSDVETNLSRRGLWDMLPSMSTATAPVGSAVDNLKGMAQRSAGDSLGSMVTMTAGLSPQIFGEPREMAKKVVGSVQSAISTAADAADASIDYFHNIHDKKKQLYKDYVQPKVCDTLNQYVETVNKNFDSTVDNMKESVKKGKNYLVSQLDTVKEKIDSGEPLMGSIGAKSSWFGSTSSGDASEESKPTEVEQEKEEKPSRKVKAPMAAPAPTPVEAPQIKPHGERVRRRRVRPTS